MLKKFSTIFLVFTNLCSFSQEKDVDVIVFQNENEIVFKVVNYSGFQQEITVDIITTNLKGNNEPVTRIVSAMDTVHVRTFFLEEGKKWAYKTNFKYRPLLSSDEVYDQQIKSNEDIRLVLENHKGITLFYKDKCSRSAYALTYLLKKNLKFNLLKTTDNKYNREILWKILKLKEPNISRFQYPVILLDGKISYNITNLEEFMEKL